MFPPWPGWGGRTACMWLLLLCQSALVCLVRLSFSCVFFWFSVLLPLFENSQLWGANKRSPVKEKTGNERNEIQTTAIGEKVFPMQARKCSDHVLVPRWLAWGSAKGEGKWEKAFSAVLCPLPTKSQHNQSGHVHLTSLMKESTPEIRQLPVWSWTLLKIHTHTVPIHFAWKALCRGKKRFWAGSNRKNFYDQTTKWRPRDTTPTRWEGLKSNNKTIRKMDQIHPLICQPLWGELGENSDTRPVRCSSLLYFLNFFFFFQPTCTHFKSITEAGWNGFTLFKSLHPSGVKCGSIWVILAKRHLARAW